MVGNHLDSGEINNLGVTTLMNQWWCWRGNDQEMPFAQPPLEFHQSLNTPFHPLELQLEKFEKKALKWRGLYRHICRCTLPSNSFKSINWQLIIEKRVRIGKVSKMSQSWEMECFKCNNFCTKSLQWRMFIGILSVAIFLEALFKLFQNQL